MPKSSTTFKKGQDKPGRGKSFKNKLLTVIKENSLIGASPKITDDRAETLYITHFAQRAFDKEDLASSALAKELLSKSYPSLKSTMPFVEFDFDAKTTPSKQASQILDAAAKGIIAPDIAQIFLSSIASLMKIDEITIIADRLTAIEKELGLNG
jgi:hypothetical protein